MSHHYVPETLRRQVRLADRLRCAYCQTSEQISGIPLTIDHIIPVSKGGATVFENLCLACRTCNEFKAGQVEADDPLSGEKVQLFQPRLQLWKDHFQWSLDGRRIEGLTPAGRATVIALRMNQGTIVAARSRWALAGWHPPES